MMKVLVTGANGLLGANLVRELNRQGYAVRALLRKGCDKSTLQATDYELFEGNITCFRELDKAVEGCDYVIHCAANTAQSTNGLDEFREVNILVTEKLCELCIEKGIRRFIFVSSANCFTNGTLENPGTEDSDFMPWLQKSGYAYSKSLAQKIVIRKTREKSLNAIVVAPTFMIGAHDGKLSSGKLTLHGLRSNIVVHPSGGKSFVDVKAVSVAIVNGLTMGESGRCYLLSGVNMTYKSFFNLVATISGKKQLSLQVPRWILLSAGTVSGIVKKIVPLQNSFNKTNARLLTLHNYFSNAKAKRDLHMPDTDIVSALTDSIQWFRQHRYISK